MTNHASAQRSIAFFHIEILLDRDALVVYGDEARRLVAGQQGFG